jgi:hypothetical protein
MSEDERSSRIEMMEKGMAGLNALSHQGLISLHRKKGLTVLYNYKDISKIRPYHLSRYLSYANPNTKGIVN